MGTTTKIQWTDHTFNPWIGCSKVHAGCANCYAEADFAIRRKRVTWGPNGTRSRTSDANWKEPLKWNKLAAFEAQCDKAFADEIERQGQGDRLRDDLATLRNSPRPRVFCASLADVFEDWEGPIVDHNGDTLYRGWHHSQPNIVAIPSGEYAEGDLLTMDDMRSDLFRLIDATPNLDWLLLTKRPENIRRMWPAPTGYTEIGHDEPRFGCRQNVWLGTSVSDQETADRMIPELLKCRDIAAKLFVSYEPALGPVDFGRWFYDPCICVDEGLPCPETGVVDCSRCDSIWISDNPSFALDWIIVGGESGPNARPCNVDWIRSTVEQCKTAGVACFVKQLGANVIAANFAWPEGTEIPSIGGRVKMQRPKGDDPSEWPEDLRVQDFPQ